MKNNSDLNNIDTSIKSSNKIKEEFGDWQTSLEFAISVCTYLKKNGISPKIILEPTCGIGNFIKAALTVFDSIEMVIGIEIFKPYIDSIENYVSNYQNINREIKYKFFNNNIFEFDFNSIYDDISNKPFLIIGNPPWVTNSYLSRVDSINLPNKSNYKKTKGIEAITGKGNFDIAESVCNLMFEKFGSYSQTTIAFLVKNSVIKNVINHQKSKDAYNIANIKQLTFDARKEFNVNVAASLLFTKINKIHDITCRIYDFYSESLISSYGWIDNNFVSNLQSYEETKSIDGHSQLIWRSGIKHDCVKVMELTKKENVFINGFHEVVDLDAETIYPFLKSSDIGNGYKSGWFHKYIVLPQNSISEDTKYLMYRCPKTYDYLLKYAHLLDGRKSIIYKNKPRFCVFGLGKYSFQKYKIVISALYSSIKFSLVEPINGRIVLLDDTCYSLGFDDLEYAKITLAILNSEYVYKFIQTISFSDAKRIISRELLMRIDLLKAIDVVDLREFSDYSICTYKKWLKSKIIPLQTNLF